MHRNCLVETHSLGPSAKIHIFGRGPDNQNWALPNDLDADSLRPHIEALRHIGVPEGTTVRWPHCSKFNALIAEPGDFTQLTYQTFNFKRGAVAAGMVVPRGEAGASTSADCPEVIAFDRQSSKLAMAHIGLGELVPLAEIHYGKPDREHPSVIDKLIAQFDPNNLNHLDFRIVCGIRARNFIHRIDDSEWGERNQKLIAYLEKLYPNGQRDSDSEVVRSHRIGKINLYELATRQLCGHGIARKQIRWDSLDTFDDNCGLWSRRKEHERGGNIDGRNWIVVVNR